MRSNIVILQTNMFRSETIANTVCYSSELSEVAEADELYQSYDFPETNCLTTDTLLAFVGC